MTRPFRPGQNVTVGDPGKKIRGTYQRMDLRYTYLHSDRDGDGFNTVIMIPNSIVFASDICVSTPKRPAAAAPPTGADRAKQ